MFEDFPFDCGFFLVIFDVMLSECEVFTGFVGDAFAVVCLFESESAFAGCRVTSSPVSGGIANACVVGSKFCACFTNILFLARSIDEDVI